jgi:hypothetical protein
MKMVPYTVMVPEHYLEFMETMGTILTDFKFVTAMEFIDSQVLINADRDFLDAVDWAVDGWIFDTSRERKEAERLVRTACRKLAKADGAYLVEVSA